MLKRISLLRILASFLMLGFYQFKNIIHRKWCRLQNNLKSQMLSHNLPLWIKMIKVMFCSEVWNRTLESIVQLIFSPCVSYFISHKYGTIAFIISDKIGGLDQKERNKLKITVKTEENDDVNLKQICDFLWKFWIKDVIEGYFGRRITNQLLWNSLKKYKMRKCWTRLRKTYQI